MWLPPRRPRALAVEVHDARRSAGGSAARSRRRACARSPACGLPRRFRAHLTLARARRAPARLADRWRRHPRCASSAEEVVLYRSYLEPRGGSLRTHGVRGAADGLSRPCELARPGGSPDRAGSPALILLLRRLPASASPPVRSSRDTSPLGSRLRRRIRSSRIRRAFSVAAAAFAFRGPLDGAHRPGGGGGADERAFFAGGRRAVFAGVGARRTEWLGQRAVFADRRARVRRPARPPCGIVFLGLCAACLRTWRLAQTCLAARR